MKRRSIPLFLASALSISCAGIAIASTPSEGNIFNYTEMSDPGLAALDSLAYRGTGPSLFQAPNQNLIINGAFQSANGGDSYLPPTSALIPPTLEIPDPQPAVGVPDGGSTALLSGLAAGLLLFFRRKLGR